MAFSWSTFFFQLINFIVLLYILRRFVYTPLFKMIDERRATIARAQEEAEEARSEALLIRQQLASERDTIDAQRQLMIEEAQAAIAAERARAEAAAQETAEWRQVELARELDAIRQRTAAEMTDDLAMMAVTVVERLLRQISDVSLHQQLCRHLVETLREDSNPGTSVHSFGTSGEPATLETAQEIDETVLTRIAEILRERMGRRVTVTVVPTPHLIAGARLQTGGYEWDSSLAGLLEHARAGMKGVNSSDDIRDESAGGPAGPARPD